MRETCRCVLHSSAQSCVLLRHPRLQSIGEDTIAKSVAASYLRAYEHASCRRRCHNAEHRMLQVGLQPVADRHHRETILDDRESCRRRSSVRQHRQHLGGNAGGELGETILHQAEEALDSEIHLLAWQKDVCDRSVQLHDLYQHRSEPRGRLQSSLESIPREAER